MEFLTELKYKFKYSTPITKIIVVNAALFLVIVFTNLFLWAVRGNTTLLTNFLALPSSIDVFMKKPWTIITYQFTHFNVFHILMNMLVLNMAGYIFLDFYKNKEALRVYILSGVSAGILYALFSNLIPALKGETLYLLYGASASVMGILFAAATYAPNIKLSLFGAIQIKLIWFALFFLLIDLISIPVGNAGGHISHLGGALFGWLYALRKKGQLPIKLFEPQKEVYSRPKHLKVEVNHSQKTSAKVNKESLNRVPTQEEVDAILDKISKSGYDRLTKEEKDILFKASQD